MIKVDMYSKKSKVELIYDIIALEEIECSDRSFANECESGTTIYNINELFSALKELKSGFTYEKAAKVYEIMENAENSWNYIKDRLIEINDNRRYNEALENVKHNIENSMNENNNFDWEI